MEREETKKTGKKEKEYRKMLENWASLGVDV